MLIRLSGLIQVEHLDQGPSSRECLMSPNIIATVRGSTIVGNYWWSVRSLESVVKLCVCVCVSLSVGDDAY